MKPLRALLWPTVMLASLFCFARVVFADAGDASAPTLAIPVGLTGWPALVVVACAVASWAIRKWAPQEHFFHSGGGQVVLAVGSAIISAVTQWASSGHLSWTTLQPLVVGAVLSAGFASNPSVGSDGKSKAAALLPVLFLPLVLVASCAHVSPDVKAFGAAYGACMEAKGLTAAPGVAEEAWNDLDHGTDRAAIVAQLEALAKQAGADAVTCAVKAWWTPGTPPTAEKNPAGVAAANEFLAMHGG